MDRAKLVAFLLESSGKCSSCGTAAWEWEADRYAYEPAVQQCWGCYLKEISRDETDGMAGARIALVPKEQAARDREHRSVRRGRA